MKNKGMLILSSLVVGLGIYAYFGEYKREINETNKKETESKIITLNRDQVNRMVFDKGAATQIVLEKTIDGWNVVQPLRDQADSEATESILDQIVGEKIVDNIVADTSTPWSDYGFEPAMGKITISTNSGKEQTVTVSTKKNFEGLVFLRRDDESRILTSSLIWHDFITRNVNHFRNLKIFRSPISQVDGISYQNSKTQFEIKMRDGVWYSPDRPEWLMDQNAIREILTQTSITKGQGIEENPPQGNPVMTLVFSRGNERWRGQFYKTSVITNPPGLHLKLGPEALEKMRDLTLVELRDKAVPFKFDREGVFKIRVKNNLKSFRLVKNKNQWDLEKADPSLAVSSIVAKDFVDRIHRLEVYQYLDMKKKMSVPMNSEIQLLDEQDNIVFQMNWSDVNNNEIFVRTNLLSENFKMDDAQINRLLAMEVVTSKSSHTSEKQEKK